MGKKDNQEEQEVLEQDRQSALDELFNDDHTKKLREKEEKKLEKKKLKALKKAEKAGVSDDDIEIADNKTEEVHDESDFAEEEETESKKDKKAKKEKKKKKEEINIVKDLISLCIYILFVVLLCWFVLTFVGQRTEVSGDSMNNTLSNGDSLWIDKASYRWFGDPERFDIVVFPYGDDDTFYIKRIIGLPGETVYIDEYGVIYINDEVLEGDTYGKEPIDPMKRGVAAEPVTLGSDEYFVMGDNRNNSRDSRVADVGNISRDRLIGKAVFRFTGGFGKIK